MKKIIKEELRNKENSEPVDQGERTKEGGFLYQIKRGIENAMMWFDNDAVEGINMSSEKINVVRTIPFVLIHILCLAPIWIGWSLELIWFGALVYFIQMFSIIGFYHRYFSHKSFKTSRFVQFMAALIGGMAVQKGALWWAANHRHHHKYSDQEEDIHSPTKRGFWWSHMGWIMADKYFPTDYKSIPDFAKFPELRLLNRFDMVIPIVTGFIVFGLGSLWSYYNPASSITGFQALVWVYFIPTILSLHGTFCVNSLAHVWGSRRFKTTDTSKNNLILSIVTLGEGWHNNHHRYQASARSGFYWWEIDVTFYILKLMSWVGLIWDLRTVPENIYQEAEDYKVEVKEKKSNA